MDSTGNLAMKLSDTHVNCVNKKRKKSLIPSSTIQRPMKIKGISVISAIKKSHHNKDFKSMKVQSIHVMNAFMKQDGRSSLQSIRNPTQKKFDQSENSNQNVCEDIISICFKIQAPFLIPFTSDFEFELRFLLFL